MKRKARTYRKRARKTYKKARKSSRRRNQPRVNRIRALGCPDELYVRLPYHETAVATGTSGAIFNRQFRSSCFDPSATVGNGQPRFYDQWCALYSKYQVLGIKYRVTFVNLPNSPNGHAVVSIANNPTIPANITNVLESRYKQSAILGASGATGTTRTISGYMSYKRIAGMKRMYDNVETQAWIGTDPDDMFFINCTGASIDGVSTFSCWMKVELTYYVRFFEMIQPGSSVEGNEGTQVDEGANGNTEDD